MENKQDERQQWLEQHFGELVQIYIWTVYLATAFSNVSIVSQRNSCEMSGASYHLITARRPKIHR